MSYDRQEQYNSRIRNFDSRVNLTLGVIESFEDLPLSELPERIQAKVKLVLELQELVNDMYTWTVDITEMDMIQDRYWGKVEERDQVYAYIESLEYRIRFETLIAEGQDALSDLEASLPEDMKDALTEAHMLAYEAACDAEFDRLYDPQY